MYARILVNFGLAITLSGALCAPRPISVPEYSLSVREFVQLIRDLSEPEGYFDSDNFVSNERAYLKILPELHRQGVSGGAYIGVGPDQNYSYIAHVKPQIAFIMDIRRQNALQHLYFKALFQLSSGRLQYLERLFGKHIDTSTRIPQRDSIADLLHLIDASPLDKKFAEKKQVEAIQVIQSWKPGLSGADYESIRFITQAFMANGPDLKFASFNRPPRSQYPSYRQLLEETDSEGVQSSYLASEENFLFIKKMHHQNRIVPIVGDLAGSYALLRAGDELRRRNIKITCFYVSNVEFYLFGGQRWNDYIRNLSGLPREINACLIRSFARSGLTVTTQVPGYYMGTLLQPIEELLSDQKAGKNTNYWNLIPRSRQR
jgi:hypothetical protein